MYSYEDRMRAVKLYIKYDYSFAAVKHELGYPKQHDSLKQWFDEYQAHSDLKHKSTRKPKYSADQRMEAINHYYNHGRCVSRTVRMLRYPSRTLLKQWLREEHPEDFSCCFKSSYSSPKSQSDQTKELHNEVVSLSAEAEELKKQIHRLQLEKDALQKAAEIIKKRSGHQS